MRFILKDIKQWRFRFEALRIGILALVIVLFWVGIELFNTYTVTTIPEGYNDNIIPLSPTLDLEVLQNIKNRLEVSDEFQVVKVAEDPPPSKAPTPKASSPSASPTTIIKGVGE